MQADKSVTALEDDALRDVVHVDKGLGRCPVLLPLPTMPCLAFVLPSSTEVHFSFFCDVTHFCILFLVVFLSYLNRMYIDLFNSHSNLPR